MHITCLGLNHTTSPIHLRETLLFDEDQVRAALARLASGANGTIAELIILSTCHRMEMYAVSSRDPVPELEILLSEARGVGAQDLGDHLYRFSGTQAVTHLFEVAAGLDSLVLGEPQILGQVARALELARGRNTSGSVLNRLFQAAIHAGKRARSETSISRNAASVSSLAAAVAEKNVPHIRGARVAVVGAGEMAELAVEALRRRGVERITVVNRTLDHARGLVERWGAQVSAFEALDQVLREADVLISSTSAPHAILSAEAVRSAMDARAGRPLILLDIAMPRDIEPQAAHIPNVKLFDIDHLNARLEASLAERAAQVPLVEKIIAQEVNVFSEFLESMDMIPLITDLHQQAETIRRAELEKTLRRLPGLSEAERAGVDLLTRSLVSKILASPTNRLRAEAACPHAPEYAAVARTLFDLPGGNGPCELSAAACPVSSAAD